MKNLFKNLALAALVLAIAAPAFSAPKKWVPNKDGTVDIELWYGAAVSEAGPPPADWVGYKIIREQLGINLIATALPTAQSDQDTKVNAAAAANSLPDIFMVSDDVFANLVKYKVVADVSDMFKMMPNRTKLLYDKDAQAASEVDGKIWGLSQPGSIVRNEGVLIRKDWLDNLKLAVPKTTADYLNVMKAFTNNDPDGNGKNDTYGFGAFIEAGATSECLGTRFDPLMGAFGVAGTWNLTAKDPGLNVRKPAYFDGLSYVKSIIDAKAIDPNWTAYKKDDFRMYWKQGRFGIFREQNAAGFSEANYAPFDKNFPKGELVIIDPPVGPKGQSSVGVYAQSYRRYCLNAGVDKQKAKVKGKNITKKQAIANLLEWMSSDEGYYLLGYGVKDVNYTLKNGIVSVDGLKDPNLAYTKPAGQPLTQLRNMVFYNGDAELASRYPTYKAAVSGKTLSSLVALREMQKKPWTANNGNSQLPTPNADLKRFLEQGVTEFMTGRRELTKANWTNWVAEFDKQGGKAWEDEAIALAKAKRLLK